MKKTMKTIIAIALTLLMLTVAAVPAMAAGFDFETAIAEFKSTPHNTATLNVGETHTPTAAVWAQYGSATCHSSDNAVVTVSADGVVTAVGEGVAYVAIDTGMMHEVYRYDVVATKPESTVAETAPTVVGTIPATGNNTTDASPDNGMDEFVGGLFENFENDAQDDAKDHMDTFSEQANNLLQGYEDAANGMMKDAQDRVDGMFVFVIILIVISVLITLAAVIYILIEAPKCGMTRFWALVPLFSSILGLLVFIVVRSNCKKTVSTYTVTCPTCNGVHPLGTAVCPICGTKLQ